MVTHGVTAHVHAPNPNPNPNPNPTVVDSMLTFISLLTLLDGGWYGILAG